MPDGERQTTNKPLILIANDQEWSARSLESILVPEGYEVIRAFTGRQAIERAGTARPDLAILDLQLPDIDGLEVSRQLRDDPRFSDSTPIILTTAGASGRAQRLEAYRAGAWEFLGQPLDGEALLLKIATYLKAKQEVDSLHDWSLIDHNTGLYTMRGLSRRAREIGSEAYRRSHALTCVVFAPAKEAPGEDSPGYVDRLGQAVGKLFRKIGRTSDAIGRLGPLEFAVIAPATDEDGANRLIERLRSAIEDEPLQLNGSAESVHLRAGFSVVPNYRDSSIEATELLLRATTALRDTEESGDSNPASIKAYQED